MSWLERISVQSVESNGEGITSYQRMKPGLTGQYNYELREKAGLHTPPTPPECMGVEGEFDPAGLVKRVAIALDESPAVDDISSLELIQLGSAIVLKGRVSDSSVLTNITELVSQVDGTEVIDTNQVFVKPE
ncbi:MAG TPA: BON domain-containing protein [Elainellaceae cyanobacterium]